MLSTQSYLTWFAEDIDNDGNTDLVTLINPTSALNVDFQVAVFPGFGDGTFGAPVVSPISLNPANGTLLTASFMKSIKVHKADYVYPGTSTASKGGILAMFDNYGIIGGRMLAPVLSSGSLYYEFKGQVPAVAGQSSQGLGWHSSSWMGREQRPEAIGILTHEV
ncbi:hypothetical protein BDV30DRAFT_232906 [Aspergillus minisclerotigenes]|uniref:VCBS repeat-containing protein n=1 Tax=Aspergillus minisclerotigenes TaxID=656917 RepID=A0A5N6JL00_9EURO|nr:hypothetical protein BDV30DRAFT_232906 [Aspergillus minisclerotigenes]